MSVGRPRLDAREVAIPTKIHLGRVHVEQLDALVEVRGHRSRSEAVRRAVSEALERETKSKGRR